MVSLKVGTLLGLITGLGAGIGAGYGIPKSNHDDACKEAKNCCEYWKSYRWTTLNQGSQKFDCKPKFE